MTRGSWLFVAALILGLSLPVIAQQAPQIPPTIVIPGQSVAGVQLGRSVSATVARLGQPVEARTLRDATLYTYPRYGLNVYVTDGNVRAVSTTNGLLRTTEGIALGSTLADVRRVYGTQFADAVVEGLMGIAYDQHGIAFGLDGVVVSVIIVYPPRTQAAAPGAAAPPPVTGASTPAASQVQPTTQIDLGLVSMPRVENLKPFSPETQYMSVVGFLRYVVYQQTGLWLTTPEASRMLNDQQRVRL
jgi:hypothetical protein